MRDSKAQPFGPPTSGGPAAVPSPQAGDGPADLAALLGRAARGDDSAFAEIYDATSSRSYGLALRVLRDPAQSEEVCQEAYLDVWRQASRFSADKGSALSWILTIVHRKAVDRVRSAEASTRRDQTYHDQNHEPDHDVTAMAAESSMEAARVRKALEHLTPIQREAIELAFLSGYTHTEVAGLLDLPVGTAKTRIRDGLIRLRDALGVAQ